MAEAITETASAPEGKAEPKAKVNLTDRLLKSLKPSERPFEVMDSQVRALGIRVMPSGVKTFILRRRYPGSTQPARRSLGTYGEMSLAQARDKAREWNASVKKGIDPALEEGRRRQAAIEAEKQRQASTFGAAFEAYLERKASKLKSGADIEREMRRECKGWMALPLADISPATVKTTIQGMVDRGAPTNAHYLLGILRAFFNWVIDFGDFNLHVSPCAKFKPTVLIGPRNVRSRVLKDFEIAAYWRAAETMGYPFGKLYQLLLLTALRREEAANARWGEIDLAAKLWVIPAEPNEGGARARCAADARNSCASRKPSTIQRRRFPLLNDRRKRPVSGFSKAKARLDGLMRKELEAQGCRSRTLSFTISAEHAGRAFLRLPD